MIDLIIQNKHLTNKLIKTKFTSAMIKCIHIIDKKYEYIIL